MNGAKLWPVRGLSDGTQLLVLSRLDQTPNKDASIQPADGLPNCSGPTVGCLCGITSLEDRGDQRGPPGLGKLPAGERSIE